MRHRGDDQLEIVHRVSGHAEKGLWFGGFHMTADVSS